MRFVFAAAGAALAFAAAAPAMAQGAFSPTTGYVNLGVSRADAGPFDVNAAHARAGARFGSYLGVEGEAGVGLGSDDNAGVEYKLKRSFAGYGVGFLPVTKNADLFARLGYGHSTARLRDPTGTVTDGASSFNYGVGAQAFVAGDNGVRVDFTRHDFRNNGGHANVFAVSYVRRF